MDNEFLQYIKYTGYEDLLDFNEEAIVKYKNTLNYKLWQLRRAWIELGNEMLKTKLGSMLISLAGFLVRCIEKIF